MKHRFVWGAAIALVLVVILILGGRRSATSAAPNAARTPVLVELFTSEGCSSCPPADAVLSEFERTQPIPGVEIIALEQHVDYWNNGSWADRFSSHAFSERQSDYASHFHNSTVYTPQMVVDGQTEFVGSDRVRAVQAITHAAHAPKANVQIVAGRSSAVGTPLQIRIEHLPSDVTGDSARVCLAVTEDGLQSDVQGGENDGHTLRHSAVVRRFSLLGIANRGIPFTAQTMVIIPSAWNRAHLQAVVFVQTQNGRRVVGVGVTPLG